MGRAAVPLDTIWPNGSDPKTLVCVKAQCSVAELFNTVFGESDLTVQLHKQRGDAELVESPWYESREVLPVEMYTWQVTDPPNKPSDTLRHRKVRFESPPTALASRPFQNEESQVITELYPDTLYVVEAVSSTSAPYGDKFNVYFRYIFRAADDGGPPASSALHLLFHVEWLPSMSRMMRPVVGKAVDAGVRGTFKIFRSVLGNLRPVVDIREADMPVGGPPAVVAHEPLLGGPAGGAEAAAGAAGLEPAGPVAAPTAGFAPGVGPPPDLLSVMTQQLVYKDQVVLLADLLGAGLRSVSASDLGAQALAAALTVWLISLLVAGLRGWQALCRAEVAEVAAGGVGAAAAAGGGGGLMWVVRLGVCWPLALLDLPDSTAEVLTSLALVAAINWAVIRGSEALVRHLNRANPGLLAAARGGGGGGPGGRGGGDVIGGVPFSQTPVLPSRGSCGGGAAAGSRASGGGAGGGASRTPSVSAPATRAASAAPPPSSTGAGGTAAGKEKDKGGGGGAGAFFAAKIGSAMAAAAAAAPSKPMRAAPAPKQFTPAQLRQLELGQVTRSKKATPPAGPAAVAPSAPPASAVPVATAKADARAADLPLGVVAPSGGSVAPRAPSPPPRAASPSPKAAAAAAAADRSAAAAAAEPASPKPTESASAAGAAAAPPDAPPPTMPQAPSPVGKGAPSAAPAAPPPAASAPSSASATSQQQLHPSGGGLTASSTFANMFTKEGIDSMAESLRSAFRWDTAKAGEGGDVGSPDSFSSPGAQQQQLAKLKARSDAGGVLTSEAAAVAAAAAAAAVGRRPTPPGQRSAGGTQSFIVPPSAAALSLFSVHSDMPLLPAVHDEGTMYGTSFGGGDDDGYEGDGMEPALVVEEVFENERFQPFRGWGHMWPGHFLPSDRVGHWSDRQGKPGGSASMAFDQVVPQLPPGWSWVEEEWQVDMEGLEAEAVDGEGWSYALDFYLLKYPPPPQGGKCSLKHFVRRRRYFRTRIRPEGRSTRCSGGSYGQHIESAPASDDYEGAIATGEEDRATATATDPLAVGERLLSLSEGFQGTTTSTVAAAVAGPPALSMTSSTPLPPGDRADQSGLELRPPPSAMSAVAAAPGDGVGLPRPRSQAEGLSEGAGARQQEESGDGRNARASLSGPAGGALPAVQVAAAPPSVQTALDRLSAGAGKDGLLSGDGGGRGALPSGNFVLSPKTEVKSHDPLGALTATERRLPPGGATDPPPSPPPQAAPLSAEAAGGGAAAAAAGQDRGGSGPVTATATAAAAANTGPSPIQGVVGGGGDQRAKGADSTVPAVATPSSTTPERDAAATLAAVAPPPPPAVSAPPLQQLMSATLATTDVVPAAAVAAAKEGRGAAAAGAGQHEGVVMSFSEAVLPAVTKVTAEAGGPDAEDLEAAATGGGGMAAATAGGAMVEGPIIAADHVE